MNSLSMNRNLQLWTVRLAVFLAVLLPVIYFAPGAWGEMVWFLTMGVLMSTLGNRLANRSIGHVLNGVVVASTFSLQKYLAYGLHHFDPTADAAFTTIFLTIAFYVALGIFSNRVARSIYGDCDENNESSALEKT